MKLDDNEEFIIQTLRDFAISPGSVTIHFDSLGNAKKFDISGWRDK